MFVGGWLVYGGVHVPLKHHPSPLEKIEAFISGSRESLLIHRLKLFLFTGSLTLDAMIGTAIVFLRVNPLILAENFWEKSWFLGGVLAGSFGWYIFAGVVTRCIVHLGFNLLMGTISITIGLLLITLGLWMTYDTYKSAP